MEVFRLSVPVITIILLIDEKERWGVVKKQIVGAGSFSLIFRAPARISRKIIARSLSLPLIEESKVGKFETYAMLILFTLLQRALLQIILH